MTIRALMPDQTATAITGIASPTVIDSLTLVRSTGQGSAGRPG